MISIFNALYPYNQNKHQPKFLNVQPQIECECGILAIAFAISIIYEINPEKVTYSNDHISYHFQNYVIESTTMRIFLYQMVNNNEIKHT